MSGSGMSGSEMVERVAEALFKAWEREKTIAFTKERDPQPNPLTFGHLAVAAITAMRVPTKEMTLAPNRAAISALGISTFEAKGSWQAMIDEALK